MLINVDQLKIKKFVIGLDWSPLNLIFKFDKLQKIEK